MLGLILNVSDTAEDRIPRCNSEMQGTGSDGYARTLRKHRIESTSRTGKDIMHDRFDKKENDAEAVDAERSGRTNAARAAGDERGPVPARWDSIGEGGEGLDELQGLYATDASAQDQFVERERESSPDMTGSSLPSDVITPALWDRLSALEGETVETPKGEPFGVKAVSRGEHVTVSPLDGGQEWDVPAQELEAAWGIFGAGEPLDGLASIRLQEAGLASAHPEYVAGLLHAVTKWD